LTFHSLDSVIIDFFCSNSSRIFKIIQADDRKYFHFFRIQNILSGPAGCGGAYQGSLPPRPRAPFSAPEKLPNIASDPFLSSQNGTILHEVHFPTVPEWSWRYEALPCQDHREQDTTMACNSLAILPRLHTDAAGLMTDIRFIRERRGD
jgi:hypothetical protein